MKNGYKMKKIIRLLPLILAVIMMLLNGCGPIKAIKNSKLSAGIYLCAELHSEKECLDKELQRWGEFYEKGARHLFIEDSYSGAQLLNIWMHEDNDDILDQIWEDTKGTQGCSQVSYDFYKTIKRDYPETIFHGTDIGHQYATTGARYVKKLEEEGKEDTEEYRITVENNESGKKFYDLGNYETIESANYREQKMVEYFIREYEALSGEFIMGIYGWGHLELDSTHCCEGTDQQMVIQLKEKYGDLIQVEGMTWRDPISTEKMIVNGKEYDATYFGETDISDWEWTYVKYRVWRLEDSYEDLKDCYPDYSWGYQYVYEYPMKVEKNEIYIMEFEDIEGNTERAYFKSDIVQCEGSPATLGISVE
jgi:hypothetical protein